MLLNIGNDNTNGISCQVVKMEKRKWKRESGRGSWMVAGSNGLGSVWGGGRQTRLWILRVGWAEIRNVETGSVVKKSLVKKEVLVV